MQRINLIYNVPSVMAKKTSMEKNSTKQTKLIFFYPVAYFPPIKCDC